MTLDEFNEEWRALTEDEIEALGGLRKRIFILDPAIYLQQTLRILADHGIDIH